MEDKKEKEPMQFMPELVRLELPISKYSGQRVHTTI